MDHRDDRARRSVDLFLSSNLSIFDRIFRQILAIDLINHVRVCEEYMHTSNKISVKARTKIAISILGAHLILVTPLTQLSKLEELLSETNPINTSKQFVWEAYKLAKANKAVTGIDDKSIANLYFGHCFPPQKSGSVKESWLAPDYIHSAHLMPTFACSFLAGERDFE